MAASCCVFFHCATQGGIRNFLAVRGPGIPQGAVNRQLLGLVDVVPTLVELAGIEDVSTHTVKATWTAASSAVTS